MDSGEDRGEVALSLSLEREGYAAYYNPRAQVYHRVPKERMTPGYFCRRMFNQGISDSYTEMRKPAYFDAFVPPGPEEARKAERFAFCLMNGVLRFHPRSLDEIRRLIEYSYRKGRTYHQARVAADPELKRYVLRKDYFRPIAGEEGEGENRNHRSSPDGLHQVSR